MSNHDMPRILPVIALAALVGCTTVRRPPPPTLHEIVVMKSQGATDAQVVALVEESRGEYQLTPPDVERLRAAGIGEGAIEAIVTAPGRLPRVYAVCTVCHERWPLGTGHQHHVHHTWTYDW